MALKQFILLVLISLPWLLPAQRSSEKEIDQLSTVVREEHYEKHLEEIELILAKDNLNPAARKRKYILLRYLKRPRLALEWAQNNHSLLWEAASHASDQFCLLLHLLEANIMVGKMERAKEIISTLEPYMQKPAEIPAAYQAYYYYCRAQYCFGTSDPAAGNNFLKALPLFQASEDPDPHLWVNCLRHLGIIGLNRGDYERAGSYFELNLEVCKRFFPPHSYTLGKAYYNLGNVYYYTMEYQKALSIYLPAYEIWQKTVGHEDSYMRYLTEAIGDMYWELDQKKEALLFYNRSVEGKSTDPVPSELDRIALADSLVKQAHYEEAMDSYDQALIFRKRIFGEKHAFTGACQNQIARTHRLKGNLDEALQAYQKAMIMLVSNFQDTIPTANPNLGMEVLSEQSLLEALTGKFFTLEARYRQTNTEEDLKLAFSTAQKAIDLLNQMRTTVQSEESLIFWGNKYYPIFGKAIDLAFELYSESEAFAQAVYPIVESSKAVVLQNVLNLDQNLTQFNIPAELLQQEKDFQKSIREYQLWIKNEERSCSRAQANKIELWRRELLEQKLAYYTFAEEVKKEYPQYYALKYNREIIPLEKIREEILIDKEKVMILYFEAEKYYYALAFTQDTFIHYRSPNTSEVRKDLDQLLRQFSGIETALQHPSIHRNDFKQAAYRWYKKLLAPILQKLPSQIDQLYLIPDQQLYYLPFDALITTLPENDSVSYAKLPYVMQQYQVSYSQSASVLCYALQAATTDFDWQYIGFAPTDFDSLHQVEQLTWNEEEVLQAATGWQYQYYQGPEATKNNFLKNDHTSQVLHLATHARIDDEQPMRSGIFFQANSPQSSVLQAYELYALSVEAELVVLNACNTSVGQWQKGEGIISFERAFQYAGCPALLTNNWAVDDQATAQLNQSFFNFLKQGENKAEALRLAKLEYLEMADPAHRHPFFWSGLRLTGNPLPLSKTSFTGRSKYWGLMLLLLAGIMWWGWRKKSIG